jgi:YXWGXW repeat-containing protein
MRSLFSLRTLLLAGFVGLVSLTPSPAKAQIAVGVSIRIAPPAIPVYEQPPCPVAGYLWTPGYWAYGAAGYYWVPGVWIAPPRVGLLWTPGYWGWGGGIYAWHAGYWGPHVGFYGGVNYGFGYGGVGFVGGEWRGGVFAYNTAVVHVNETVIHNTYVNRTVIVNNTTVNRTSFNGGPGGLSARANAQEIAASRESHVQPTSLQASNEHAASLNRANFASENHGRPATPAMSRVNAREANQQARIGQGVRSGQLTPGETSHLENKEAGINREVRSDRAANGGHLTQQERTQVNHQQNAVSRDINRDKHNARTDHPVQERNEHPHR